MVIDVYGHEVPDTQPMYQGGVAYGSPGNAPWLPNPDYNPNAGQPAPAPAEPSQQITFDTMGQVITRSIGHCRLPFKLIWVQGITFSGEVIGSAFPTNADAPAGSNVLSFDQVPSYFNVNDSVTLPTAILPAGTRVTGFTSTQIFLSNGLTTDLPAGSIVTFGGAPSTITAAWAICAPFDATEDGDLSYILNGENILLSTGGVIHSDPSLDPIQNAQLALALAAASRYRLTFPSTLEVMLGGRGCREVSQ